jgi:ankyrin repeat protein
MTKHNHNESHLTHSYEMSMGTDTMTTAFGEMIFESYRHSNHAEEERVRALAQQPIDWETESHYPLSAALDAGWDDLALTLLHAGSPVISQHFYVAYRFGSHQTFQELVNRHLSILAESQAQLIFIDAARWDDLETMKIIRPTLSNLDTEDYFYGTSGWTALHHAASNCNYDMAHWLLQAGVNPTLATEKKQTVVELCLRYSRKIPTSARAKTVNILLDHGAAMPAKLSWLQKWALRRGYVI